MILSMTLLAHVLAACAVLLLQRSAGAVSVDDVLARVETRARFARPMRADVRIVCQPACRAARAILIGRGDAVYVELEGGLRALVRPKEALVAEGGRVVPAELGKHFGDTALLLQDLAVFDRTVLRTPQISDEGPDEVVITSEPAGASVYALIVHTVDPATDRIVKTLYYQGSVNTLAKMRRDGAFTRVGDVPYPGEIRLEEMRTATTNRLELVWREAPEAPSSLFEPGGLEKPSGLQFPP
jgi:hypothetical protein